MQTLDFALEIKSADDEKGTFEGYASTFGNRDRGGDIVVAGAFAKSLKHRGARGVKMFADHDPRQRIGVWSRIEEDEKGLYVEGRLLIEKQIGREAWIDLKAGSLDSMSIGFRTVADKYDGRRKARLLQELDLLEISLISFPMNEEARVTAVKSALGPIDTIRKFEEFLWDAGGFSRAAAKAIAAGGFKAFDPRDEDEAAGVIAALRRNINTLTPKGK